MSHQRHCRHLSVVRATDPPGESPDTPGDESAFAPASSITDEHQTPALPTIISRHFRSGFEICPGRGGSVDLLWQEGNETTGEPAPIARVTLDFRDTCMLAALLGGYMLEDAVSFEPLSGGAGGRLVLARRAEAFDIRWHHGQTLFKALLDAGGIFAAFHACHMSAARAGIGDYIYVEYIRMAAILAGPAARGGF
ncbi:MAG TPA: hypothetical protein VFA95_11605 [Gammaproteobacteria bacterium]|nr:hypothetical protein [Gammaproteobacteria bacterium]